MCPVCGTPLDLATEAPQANRERAFIERQIAACRSKEEIRTALAAEFGDDVLALPDDEGFDLFAWLVPALGALLALAGIALGLRRWRSRSDDAGGPPPAGAAPSGETAAKLDADMERYDL
jgi:cytochrome c-type biogenesis protein CcmH/NrfF